MRLLLDRLIAPSPLRHPGFRRFYGGWAGVALGYTMQSTAAAWLMATLTPSALMVALVQTASTVPMLLFGIFAGALADIIDRSRIIRAAMVMVTATSVLFAIAALAGFVGPPLLLLLIFIIGAGVAFYLPAQQSTINELVSHADLPASLALSAAAFNVARAAGPALAGAIAAWAGTGSALLVSAVCFLPTFLTVSARRVNVTRSSGVAETLLGGIRSGLRYARHSAPMRSLLIRNLSFSVCASALLALLPVIARDQFRLGIGGYGALYATFGLGAIIAALCLGRLLRRTSLTTIMNCALLGSALASAIIASTQAVVVAGIAVCTAGFAWLNVFSGLAAATQSTAPAWVRSRTIALALLTTQGGVAIGSAVWGAVASEAGTSVALAASSCVMGVLFLFNRRLRVELGNAADVMPDARPSDLAFELEPAPQEGPVMIEVHYQIDRERSADFTWLVQELQAIRRRNGASDWLLFRDLEASDRFVERFMIASWAEFTRVRSRMTQAERRIHDRVLQMQKPAVPVRISRFIAVDPARRVQG